jgi:protein-tyrosine phosphatase
MPAATPADLPNRLLPLAGGHNFRDLGGYRTADGQRVRWRVLYRSGKLSALTAEDVAQLATRGIQVVCDLRTPAERSREPSVAGWAAAHHGWEYAADHHALRTAASAPGATPQHVQDALAATYREMPWHFAEAYGSAFRHLIDGRLPLVFHCTAGKDRTGTLAALILRALDVPEPVVMADYLLTTQCLDVQALVAAPPDAAAAGPSDAAGFSFIRAMSPELRAPLLSCHPAYLQSALRAVEARHGSVRGYVEAVLGIGADGLATLRQRLLEPADCHEGGD